jgi:hypothetical protein
MTPKNAGVKSNEQFSKYLSEISKTLLDAKTFYEMWLVLRGPKRPKYANILNEYNHFSRALITATFTTAVIALYKATDKKSYNLEKLFKALPKDQFNDQDIDAYKNILEKHKAVIKAINILRNNVFAHNSESLDSKASFQMAGFIPKECKAFIDDVVKIICDIYYKHQNLVHNAFFKYKAASEMESILQILMASPSNQQPAIKTLQL